MSDNGLLFDEEELVPWLAEWQNMPEYSQEDLTPAYQLIVSFLCAEDVKAFSDLIGQAISTTQGKAPKSLWYPEQQSERTTARYIQVER